MYSLGRKRGDRDANWSNQKISWKRIRGERRGGAWAGQDEGKPRREVVAFLAGTTTVWAQAECRCRKAEDGGEITALPLHGWSALWGKGLFKGLEAKKTRGGQTPGYQLCFVPMMRKWSCCYQVEKPGKTDTCLIVSLFLHFSECS